jgi:hypothetical protein
MDQSQVIAPLSHVPNRSNGSVSIAGIVQRIKDVLVITILFVGLMLMYRGQPRITVNQGRGYDGVQYHHSAEQFLAGIGPVEGYMPYVRRVGAAWLPAWLTKATGLDLLDSAMWLDLLAAYLSSLLLVIWLSHWLPKPWMRYMLVALLLFSPLFGLRSSFYYPMQSDPWGAFFFLAALLVMNGIASAFAAGDRRHLMILLAVYSLFIALGMLFRETLALLAVAVLFIAGPVRSAGSAWSGTAGRSLRAVGRAALAVYRKPMAAWLFLPIPVVIVTDLWVDGLVQVNAADQYSYWTALFEWLHR